MSQRPDFTFEEHIIAPGSSKTVQLYVSRMFDHTDVTIPVRIIHGKNDGPTLFVSAAIHGDEINGVEIIKRLLSSKSLKKISGTLIAIPIVNVFGFNNNSRYLPDRRDLNRCFPGSDKGSLAARIANLFTKTILQKSDYGIDLHTGAVHRKNFPQIRAFLKHKDKRTTEMAHSFNAPVILDASLKDGSLREAAVEQNIPILIYEGGEALRFDESSIKIGVKGVLSVMKHIGMIEDHKKGRLQNKTSHVASDSYWVRAPGSGIFTKIKRLGALVKKDQVIGHISDHFGEHKSEIIARTNGIIICQHQMPLVNTGDALFHIATFEGDQEASEIINQIGEEYRQDIILPPLY